MVAEDSRFPFSRVGEIEVAPLRQVQRIAEQGAQQERRGRAPPKGTHHQLERAMYERPVVT